MFYNLNLDVILSVEYRVDSARATQQLCTYILRLFVIADYMSLKKIQNKRCFVVHGHMATEFYCRAYQCGKEKCGFDYVGKCSIW